MGAGGIPNRSVEITHARSLKIIHKPNMKVNRLNEYGELIQSRWYDNEGKAVRNRDFKHQDSHKNHFFPHDHSWTWDNDIGHRNKKPLVTDYKNFQ